jgi:FlaA1/EpsC-like NDP-sugar epimerase
VLGSNGSVIPRFKKQIEEGQPITVTHPDITRYFMTIGEACQLVLEAGATGKGGEIFIFDMGKPVRIDDLARKMIRLSGLEVDKDIAIRYTGLRPGEKLYEELLADQENTLPTHHEKIMIAKVRTSNLTQITQDVDQLESLFNQQDNIALVRLMKRIVPEFISKAPNQVDIRSTVNGFFFSESCNDFTFVIEPLLPAFFHVFAFGILSCKAKKQGVVIRFTHHQLLVKVP